VNITRPLLHGRGSNKSPRRLHHPQPNRRKTRRRPRTI